MDGYTLLCALSGVGGKDGAVTWPLWSACTNLRQAETEIGLPLHHVMTHLQKQITEMWIKEREREMGRDDCLAEKSGVLTLYMQQTTWKMVLCMTEHTVSAYCLLWVYVAQGSGGAPLGKAQCSVVNFPANNDTLFSTSPSGVVKSSCWFQVSVPHRPRTLNRGINTFFLFFFINSSNKGTVPYRRRVNVK